MFFKDLLGEQTIKWKKKNPFLSTWDGGWAEKRRPGCTSPTIYGYLQLPHRKLTFPLCKFWLLLRDLTQDLGRYAYFSIFRCIDV